MYIQSGEGMILKLERYALHCLRKSILFSNLWFKKRTLIFGLVTLGCIKQTSTSSPSNIIMDLRLTESIHTAVKKALAVPEFSEKYKQEAEKIAHMESVPKEPSPVSTDLVEYVAKRLGIL